MVSRDPLQLLQFCRWLLLAQCKVLHICIFLKVWKPFFSPPICMGKCVPILWPSSCTAEDNPSVDELECNSATYYENCILEIQAFCCCCCFSPFHLFSCSLVQNKIPVDFETLLLKRQVEIAGMQFCCDTIWLCPFEGGSCSTLL